MSSALSSASPRLTGGGSAVPSGTYPIGLGRGEGELAADAAVRMGDWGARAPLGWRRGVAPDSEVAEVPGGAGPAAEAAARMAVAAAGVGPAVVEGAAAEAGVAGIAGDAVGEAEGTDEVAGGAGAGSAWASARWMGAVATARPLAARMPVAVLIGSTSCVWAGGAAAKDADAGRDDASAVGGEVLPWLGRAAPGRVGLAEPGRGGMGGGDEPVLGGELAG